MLSSPNLFSPWARVLHKMPYHAIKYRTAKLRGILRKEIIFALLFPLILDARCLILTTMIGRIEGTVFAVRPGFAIISANGVGYKVAATRATLAPLKPNTDAALWTHLEHVFGLLLTVPGIGPRSALAILDIASI